MHRGGLGEPEFPGLPHLKQISPVKNGGVLAGAVYLAVGNQWQVMGQMRGQILQLGHGALLGAQKVGAVGQNDLHHQLLTVFPFIRTVLGGGKAEIEGHQAHIQSQANLPGRDWGKKSSPHCLRK